MADVKVVVQGLHASAQVAKGLAEELRTPVQAALTSATTTSGQLVGWSIAAGLGQLGSSWSAPLSALQQRIVATGSNLDANATAHNQNELTAAGVWSQQGAKP
ncbi:hypothetical protein [Kitasatospora purpeofusca]|uniref:hypothetical protein n=1 Tax=Kitasatospora purpeofusca TaxID=67352 RepID=UPI0004BF915D|nr:hypothetical protein [Kitasatospora purpeofusca]